MKTASSNQHCALIVGSSADEFTRYAVELVCRCEIYYILCGDIYSAAGMLAKNSWRDALVIGRFENLNKEDGWIFRSEADRKISCCCLAGAGSAINHRQLAAVRRADVFIINKMEELELVIMEVLALKGRRPSGKIGRNIFNKDEFAATRAEMDALLGA